MSMAERLVIQVKQLHVCSTKPIDEGGSNVVGQLCNWEGLCRAKLTGAFIRVPEHFDTFVR